MILHWLDESERRHLHKESLVAACHCLARWGLPAALRRWLLSSYLSFPLVGHLFRTCRISLCVDWTSCRLSDIRRLLDLPPTLSFSALEAPDSPWLDDSSMLLSDALPASVMEIHVLPKWRRTRIQVLPSGIRSVFRVDSRFTAAQLVILVRDKVGLSPDFDYFLQTPDETRRLSAEDLVRYEDELVFRRSDFGIASNRPLPWEIYDFLR